MYFLADEPEPEQNCFCCMHKEDVISDVQYWLRAVLDQLYGLEEFNQEDLERYIEELAHVVEMRIPQVPLAVVREKRTVETQPSVDLTPVLNAWKILSTTYLKSLTNTGI
jgi:hypothetical protein